MGEGVKKSIWFFFTPFRRKPESSLFKPLVIDWTPVFTGISANLIPPLKKGGIKAKKSSKLVLMVFTGGAAVPNFSLREG